MTKTTCACGCGLPLPPRSKKNPNRGASFISTHWNRTPAFREMKKLSRERPPRGWRPPSGKCECGCGATTTIARSTKKSQDVYAGYPRRFVQGHHMRLQAQGAGNNRWKGGRSTMQGYVLIRIAPYKYRAEHILKWEAKHGPVPKGWHVHHLNGNRADNRLANLICLTRSQHAKLHAQSPDHTFRRRQAANSKTRRM